jgi:hypothetical protein
MHYKYGGKTLYYFNTFDGAGEIEEPKPQNPKTPKPRDLRGRWFEKFKIYCNSK